MSKKTHIAATQLRALSAALDEASTSDAVVQAALAFIREETRFERLWLFLVDRSDMQVARLAAITGDFPAGVVHPKVISIPGDEYVKEILGGTKAPVVIIDAEADSRVNPAVVGPMGSRTIINTPLVLVDRFMGALGTGTFGEEGARAPTEHELAAFEIVASYVSIAVDRNRLLSERLAVERDLQVAQRQQLAARMLAGAAHDFNNALTVISGQTAVLRRTKDPKKVDGALASISSAVDVAAALVKRIQGRRGTPGPAENEMDAGMVVRDLMGLSRALLAGEIEFVARLPTTETRLRCDRVAFEQIYLNLLVNARDAVSGLGRIEVDLEGTPDGVVLSVHDDGCGMDAELLSHVREAFFTTKAEGRGTGLGLFVVDRLVNEAGGQLVITSTVGAGTTIRIEFPL